MVESRAPDVSVSFPTIHFIAPRRHRSHDESRVRGDPYLTWTPSSAPSLDGRRLRRNDSATDAAQYGVVEPFPSTTTSAGSHPRRWPILGSARKIANHQATGHARHDSVISAHRRRRERVERFKRVDARGMKATAGGRSCTRSRRVDSRRGSAWRGLGSIQRSSPPARQWPRGRRRAGSRCRSSPTPRCLETPRTSKLHLLTLLVHAFNIFGCRRTVQGLEYRRELFVSQVGVRGNGTHLSPESKSWGETTAVRVTWSAHPDADTTLPEDKLGI